MKKTAKVLGASTMMAGVLPHLYFLGKHHNKKATKGVQIITSNQVATNQTEYFLLANGNFPLFTKVYHVEKPKAVVQLVHGAMEHQGRYFNLIKKLNQQGYAVVANDHRGHGRSVTDKYPKGFMNGTQELLNDLVLVTDFINQLYPEVPVYMFGHSMGSMLARAYLLENDQRIDKLILTGVPPYNPMVSAGITLAKLIGFYRGEKASSSILNVLPKELDWIAYNQQHLQKIADDPLGMEQFTNGGNLTMFELNRLLNFPKKFKAKHSDLPILLLNGADDTLITGGSNGIDDSARRLTKAGYRHLVLKQYPNMKHEIIHEKDADTVFEDILSFYRKTN